MTIAIKLVSSPIRVLVMSICVIRQDIMCCCKGQDCLAVIIKTWQDALRARTSQGLTRHEI